MNAGESHDALLGAVLNLSRFHRDHEKFYATAPREQAVALQRHERTLLALADRWSTVEVVDRPPRAPFEGAEDLNDASATQLDGVLFMEGEGPPAEIVHAQRDLLRIAEDAESTGTWLAGAMEAAWDVAGALVDVPPLAGVLGERHRIIANDWQAASMSALTARLLRRAGDILDRIDFSPPALRRDLAGDAVVVGRLYSAAELVARAADLLSESAGLVHDNERRWRAFRVRVEHVTGGRAPA